MSATPEAVVKKQVRQLLKDKGAYYSMPVTGGMGRNGAPDFLACYKGHFIGIECKADDAKKMTTLQGMAANDIRQAGGQHLLIHKNNMDVLRTLLLLIDLKTKTA